MAKPEILIAKFFRQEWGDVGMKNIPLVGDELEGAKVGVGRALEGYFGDPNRHSRQKPHTAQLIGEDRRIVATFQMREVFGVGPKSVEV
jgi:hypothetical protein